MGIDGTSSNGITFKRLILIRHGRPDWRLPHLISLAEYQQGLMAYDAAPLSIAGVHAIEALAVQLPAARILCSDLSRAVETAKIIGRDMSGTQFDAVFRELQVATLSASWLTRMRMPPPLWSMIHWIHWLMGRGECHENHRAAWQRAGRATGLICAAFCETDTIILVSHGWFISLLTLYLRRRGLIQRGPFVPKVKQFGGMTEYVLRVS